MDMFVIAEMIRGMVVRRLRSIRLELRLADSPDETPLTTVIGALLKLTNMVNYHSLATKSDLDQIWAVVRSNDYTYNFVMSLAVEFRTYYSTTKGLDYRGAGKDKDKDGAWNALVDCLSAGLASVRDTTKGKGASVFSDDEFRDKGFDQLEWGDYFRENSWLVTVYLLTLTGVGSETVMEALYRNKEESS